MLNYLRKLVELRGVAPSILFVDDQPAIIHALSSLFDESYHLYFATTGSDAIQKCLEVLPDLIVLDLHLPDLSGFEVCKKLKSIDKSKHIPVMFLTASRSEDDEVAGFVVGAVDFIYKPINSLIVKTRIDSHLTFSLQGEILRKMATIDGLTGVANRQRFDEQLELEWAQSGRDGEPLSLLMIDVDFFKRFNDHYGHQCGDDCLKKVGQALKSVSRRPYDFVGRYGGEEFVMMLPKTDVPGAQHVAGKVLAAIQELAIEHLSSDVAPVVTVSVGVATMHAASQSSPFILLSQADMALYQAKKAGRNQFCHYALLSA